MIDYLSGGRGPLAACFTGKYFPKNIFDDERFCCYHLDSCKNV